MSEKPKYRIAHVGINNENSEEAYALTKVLCDLFGVEPNRDGPNNIFAGDLFEVMKHSRRGAHGHIGLQTDDVEAAMADLAAKGITFQEDTYRYDENGKIRFVYLKQEFGGFQFHLTK
ncbi:MAG: hypothetical protein II882_03420 [Lachnospiraceae bacterium]|nr:hypothetical protein [Lachnospiraceae bacterium]